MPTIRDVADLAEVSTATVSHVINGTRYVSPELTARIRAVMAELDYRPDAVAQSLRRGRTMTLGLIVPSVEIPFYACLAFSIERAASRSNYNLILCNSEWELSRELAHLEELVTRRVDGLFCISAEIEAHHLQPITDAGMPIVTLEREVRGSGLDSVSVDSKLGGYVATKHLIELGHRRIGFILGRENSTLSEERLAGSRHALAEAGLPFDRELVARGNYDVEGGRDAAKLLLHQRGIPPTAIFAFNDLMALGVLQIVDDDRHQVPEDVAVVGFDGIPLTAEVTPAMTTVKQPFEALGSAAVDLLIERITSGGTFDPRAVRLMPELIVRHTTVRHRKPMPVRNV